VAVPAYASYTAWLQSVGTVKPIAVGTSTEFDGLKAGSYTVGVSACVDHTKLTGYVTSDADSDDDGSDALCPTSGGRNYSWASNTKYKNSNTAPVYTKPDVVAVASVTRDSDDSNYVKIDYTDDVGATGGGAGLKIEYSTKSAALDNFSSANVLDPDNEVDLGPDDITVWFLACTDLGCSPDASVKITVPGVS
jgi:hypothetical protein